MQFCEVTGFVQDCNLIILLYGFGAGCLKVGYPPDSDIFNCFETARKRSNLDTTLVLES